MTISENIAKYRKKKGYTQEKLGEILGVTNQAVSKWEGAVSMPDVMMLPPLAEALGITLQELYGIEKAADKKDEKNEKVRADDFPQAAKERLIEYFEEQSGAQFHTDTLEDPWSLVCVSDNSGVAYISNNITFIDPNYKAPSSERIFNMDEIASAMKKLSDSKVRAVLAYMYHESFVEKHTWCKDFLLSDISSKCNLSKEEALDAMEKLLTLKLLETLVNDEKVTEYIFLKSRAYYVLAAFKAVELLIQETHSYEVVRDTSLINDYAFEKLWK